MSTMTQRRFILAAVIALQGALLTAAAHAACSLSSAAIAFGNYDPISSTPLDTAGSTVYRCGTNDHNITITLSRGGGTSFSTRRMVRGSDQLFYNLYLDAARTVVWGDGSGGTQAYFINNPPNNQNVTVPIFGRAPASQNVAVGAYSDTITITLIY